MNWVAELLVGKEEPIFLDTDEHIDKTKYKVTKLPRPPLANERWRGGKLVVCPVKTRILRCSEVDSMGKEEYVLLVLTELFPGLKITPEQRARLFPGLSQGDHA